MDDATLHVADAPGDLRRSLYVALHAGPPWPQPVLVNVGLWPVIADVVQRCVDFAAALAPAEPALVVTILTPVEDTPDTLARQMDFAGAWAFTRHAALAWAPRRIRVNAIGLGARPPSLDPTLPPRGAGGGMREPAVEDIVRTIRAIAGFPSMTGQIIRLGL